MVLIGLMAGISVTYSAACALGQAPWLTLPLTFGTLTLPDAGVWVQLSVTALSVAIAFFLPTNARVLALEDSHRKFHIGMRDVARAYRTAHAEDRKGAFNMKSEFDSVRARMAFLRDHPDLADLEPSILEVASQMSHISRELATVYSDASMARARDFLIQRQQDIEEFNARLEEAKLKANEMRRWVMEVEMAESIAEAQLVRLCEDLTEILPEIALGEPAPDAPPAEPMQEIALALPAEADDWEDATETDDRIVELLSRRVAE
ncbi:DNA repair protein [Mesobacterium sp. TK19101]|uniref:DNA repair protein n=1 Tax=Mesobacterium hydrothermale TaxID=3111907 RepID=A0ABU6HF22_9RHOB|nr:DNA repair protein [Mesobacterium sp. TK19101]MEC3861064.1 DNA repair protein [Mesobacterium sp. TK19101]